MIWQNAFASESTYFFAFGPDLGIGIKNQQSYHAVSIAPRVFAKKKYNTDYENTYSSYHLDFSFGYKYQYAVWILSENVYMQAGGIITLNELDLIYHSYSSRESLRTVEVNLGPIFSFEARWDNFALFSYTQSLLSWSVDINEHWETEATYLSAIFSLQPGFGIKYYM
jgi:hypothetical protein